VSKEAAEKWCKENGNMMHFETSAFEGKNVEDAFITMAKAAIKREAEVVLPASMMQPGTEPKNLKLKQADHKTRGQTQTNCTC